MRTEKQKANLRPIELTHDEAVKNGSKGGKKSAQKRRQLKTWKEVLNILASTPTNENNKAILKSHGIEDEDATAQAYMLYQNVFMKAMKGERWAIEMWAKITDNFGVEKIEVKDTTTNIAERIKEYARNKKS